MIPGHTLSLITLNTWKCDGEYRIRLRLMAEGLAELNPDIILLQECFKTDHRQDNTARVLANTLSMNSCYLPAREKLRTFEDNPVASHSGLAVLSRFPLAFEEVIELPSDPEDGDRKAQVVSIKIDQFELLIVNTHLTYLRDAHRMRAKETKLLFERIRKHEKCDAIILGGDFNAEPDSRAIKWLMKQKKMKITDIAAAGSKAKPEGTKLDMKSDEPDLTLPRIDYLFLIEPPKKPCFEVISSDIVLKTPDPITGLLPSDHLGVRGLLKKI